MFDNVRGFSFNKRMRTHFLTAIRACDKKINLKYIQVAFGIHEFMNSCCQQCQLPIACSLKNLVLSLLLEEALGPPVHCRMEGMLWALHQCNVSSFCVSLAQLLC